MLIKIFIHFFPRFFQVSASRSRNCCLIHRSKTRKFGASSIRYLLSNRFPTPTKQSINSKFSLIYFSIDEDRPFLLALYVTTLSSGEKGLDETFDFFAADQTDKGFTPRNLAFPLPPDRVPISFIIRGSVNSKMPQLEFITLRKNNTSSLTENLHDENNSSILYHPPRIFAENDNCDSLKGFVDRPKSTMYPEVSRVYRHHLRDLSQSSHNLSPTGASGNNSGKGRSRSRLRLPFTRGNSAFTGDDDADDKDPTIQSGIIGSNHFGIFGRLPKEAWPDCRVSMSVMVGGTQITSLLS